MISGLLAVGCNQETTDEGDEEEVVGEAESAQGCIPSEVGDSCGIQPQARPTTQDTAKGGSQPSR